MLILYKNSFLKDLTQNINFSKAIRNFQTEGKFTNCAIHGGVEESIIQEIIKLSK